MLFFVSEIPVASARFVLPRGAPPSRMDALFSFIHFIHASIPLISLLRGGVFHHPFKVGSRSHIDRHEFLHFRSNLQRPTPRGSSVKLNRIWALFPRFVPARAWRAYCAGSCSTRPGGKVIASVK